MLNNSTQTAMCDHDHGINPPESNKYLGNMSTNKFTLLHRNLVTIHS